MTRTEKRAAERRERDAFYGGYCCALTAALFGDDGTSTGYVEAVGAVDARELLNFARRNNDRELPNIRRAIRSIAHRDATLAHYERSKSAAVPSSALPPARTPEGR